VSLICLALTPGAAFAQLAIRHDAVGCVVAERFPSFEARFEPVERLGRARLHFRPEASRYWYSVAMTREGELFRAVMPKPRRSLKSFSYYIEATDVDFAASRTQEYAPRVVGGPAECQQTLVAAVASTASVVVEAPAGAPAIPVGFAATGVTATVAAAAGTVVGAAAGTPTGAAAGTAAGATASGGGVSLGLVAGVVGGAAVVAGVAVAAGGESGSKSTGQGGVSTPPSGGTGGGTTTPPATPDLTGRWVGTAPDGATDTSGNCAGQQEDTLVVLTQTASNLAGTFDATVRVAGPAGCAPPGTRETGTLAGTAGAGTLSFTLTITEPPGIRPVAATGTFTANRMSGTFQNIGGSGAGIWSTNRQ
jgi:hypothetical protein